LGRKVVRFDSSKMTTAFSPQHRERRNSMAFDLVDSSDRYASQFHAFYLDPEGWRKFDTPHDLMWTKIKFTQANRSLIPIERGVYAFTVEHCPSKFPKHGYLLYIGITGNQSGAHLRQRYSQYLQNQSKEKGRPAVLYMLKKWPDNLFFSYCQLPDSTVNLAVLETDLLGALNPPVNKKDFPASISAARRARFF
jgi:hypothetical protein